MKLSIQKTAVDLDMSIGTVHIIMTKDLGYKPYNKRKVYGVTEAATKKKLDRAKLILPRHAGQEFVFSDEKLFVLQQPYNSASSVIVWEAISWRGKLPMVFIERIVKINAVYYKTEVLEKVVALAFQDLYGKDHYVFQYDGVPINTA
ncbi:uncharacterized protein LOC129719837 [Wyeomyia smithii]|uniref:uncharacterized protein LOC129719837 n=1 Tax=Wyeomyia smithii TaxID=174621 RepID=UPI002467EBF1|nr:uncharacterized protein LOC129719837 [Wyeomyia smithii]